MIKVLLVDDEKVVREDLETLIDWEKHGFRLLEAASNGRQALQIFKRDRPHIVISDIRMPLSDGLQLAQAIRKINPGTVIILLTAYKDPEYAISAVNIGVARYLLKSSLDSQSLLNELNAVKKQILSARPADGQELRNLIYLLMHHTVSEEDYFKAVHLLQLPDRDAEYCVLKARIDAYVGSVPTGFDALYDKLRQSIEFCAAELVAGQGGQLVTEIGFNDFMILFHGTVHLNAKARMAEIVSLCRAIQRQFQQGNGQTLSFGVSNLFYSLRNCPQQFQSAEGRLKLAYFEGDNTIIDSTAADRLGQAREKRKAMYLLAEMRQLINERRFEECNHMLGLLFQAAPDETEANAIAIELEDLLSTLMIEMGKTKNELYGIDQSPMAVFARMRNSQQFISFFSQAIARLDASSGTRHRESTNFKAQEAISFIKENFAHPIKLQDISQALHLSKEYTSTMFKRATGENLFSFLTRYRIEEARKKLMSSDRHVQEIAEEVGFANLQHFSAVFKKQLGCAPTEFRRKNLRTALRPARPERNLRGR